MFFITVPTRSLGSCPSSFSQRWQHRFIYTSISALQPKVGPRHLSMYQQLLIIFGSIKPAITRNLLLCCIILRVALLQRVSDSCVRVDCVLLVRLGRLSAFKGAFFRTRVTMEPGTPDRYPHQGECLVLLWVSCPCTWGQEHTDEVLSFTLMWIFAMIAFFVYGVCAMYTMSQFGYCWALIAQLQWGPAVNAFALATFVIGGSHLILHLLEAAYIPPHSGGQVSTAAVFAHPTSTISRAWCSAPMTPVHSALYSDSRSTSRLCSDGRWTMYTRLCNLQVDTLSHLHAALVLTYWSYVTYTRLYS